MSKFLFLLAFALILLGFLVSNSINMLGDIQDLKAENQRISRELVRLQTAYQSVVQERDGLIAENGELKRKVDVIQQAYETEKQARLEAEGATAIYKGMLVNMMQTQTESASACSPVVPQEVRPEAILFSGFVPFGAGFVGFLALIGLAVVIKNHTNVDEKPKNLVAHTRNFR